MVLHSFIHSFIPLDNRVTRTQRDTASHFSPALSLSLVSHNETDSSFPLTHPTRCLPKDVPMEKMEFTGPGCAEVRCMGPEHSRAFADGDGSFRIRGCNQGGAGPWSAPSE